MIIILGCEMGGKPTIKGNTHIGLVFFSGEAWYLFFFLRSAVDFQPGPIPGWSREGSLRAAWRKAMDLAGPPWRMQESSTHPS